MLRALKWTVALLLAFAVLLALFRGPIYRACSHYEVLGSRGDAAAPAIPQDALDKLVQGPSPSGANGCIDAALDATAEALTFTTDNVAGDAPGVLRTGRANCMGYAALFKAICDRRLANAGLAHQWKVVHLVGELHCGSFNIHSCFSSPFWKDHDICIISDLTTGERIYVDPTLYDALHIRRVRGPVN